MSGRNHAVKAAGFFRKYRDAVLFNRNLIIAGAGGFFASANVSQLYAQHDANDLANSAVAVAIEYAVYIPVFAALFYVDNRSKYVDPANDKRDSRRIWQDVKKLFAAFSVSEVIFAITRFAIQYALLQAGSQPYEASMMSSLVAWGVFFVAINSMAKLVRLFRR
jgi:Na+-driven multidrug efflux pump